MDIYSKLNGSTPISPVSGGVWKIQKKRKTDDEKQRNKKGKKESKEEKDLKDDLPDHVETDGRSESYPSSQTSVGYGPGKKRKKAPRKIDLTI